MDSGAFTAACHATDNRESLASMYEILNERVATGKSAVDGGSSKWVLAH